MQNQKHSDTEMTVGAGLARRARRLSQRIQQTGYGKPYLYRDLVRALLFVGVALMAPAALYSQTVSFAGVQSTVPASGLNSLLGVAVDGAGNVFIADTRNNRVVEVPAGGGAQTTVGSGLDQPYGVAVDGAGDVFIAEPYDRLVVKVPAGCTSASCQTTVGSGLYNPYGVAVDGAGNVFIADSGTNSVLKVSPGGAQTTMGTGLSAPIGVAVDGAGDVFIAESGNNQTVEVPAGCTSASCQTTVDSNLFHPQGVAVDGAGDVFIADSGNRRVVEVPAGCTTASCQTAVGSGLSGPIGVAVDGAGDVFIADYNRVVEVQTIAMNFGSINIGAASQTATLNYNITASGTLGTPNVLTHGAPSLDFTLGSGSTCTGAVAAVSTCAVNVTFAPQAPGLRMGAVELTDSSGNVLAATLLHGEGQGPAVAFGPGVQTTVPASGLNIPEGVAVDGAGDIYIVDSNNNRVLEVSPGGAQTTVASGLSNPFGVAVDGAGDVFIADLSNNRVLKVSPGGAQTTVGSGLRGPTGVAVDGAGDIFIADYYNNRVVKVPASSGAQTTVGSGLYQPVGVAVDGAGDVFIADSGNSRVVEVPAGGGAQTTVGSGLNYPYGVAVDGAGDVFIADTRNSRVVEVPAGCTSESCQTTVGSGLSGPYGVAVDGAGDVFIADTFNSRAVEVQRSQAPALSFAATAVGSTSSDSPQAVTVQNIGNQPLNALAPSLGITGANGSSFAQVAGSGTPLDCTSTFSLAPGATCNLSLSFTPQAAGSLQGTEVLTDNTLNGAAATQNIGLSGTGTAVAVASVSPTSLPFGNQLQGATSAAQTVTLSNAGTAALSITSIAISGNFAISNNPCGSSLAQNSSCQIGITFTPQSTGALTGTLTITDNNNGVTGSTQTVSLSGTGTSMAVASASPTSLPFGNQLQGTTSAAQTVTLSNTGNAALSITSIAISGNFAISSNPCGNSLAQNSSCQIGITFKPQSTGALTGTLTVTDNNKGVTGSTQTVSLSGIGTNFSIAASPASQTISSGKTATYTLTLGSISGFSGTVALSCIGAPLNLTLSLSPGSVNLNANGTATATATLSGKDQKGTYILTFTARSGGVMQSANASLTLK